MFCFVTMNLQANCECWQFFLRHLKQLPLYQVHCGVIWCWIPCHVGLKGSTRATPNSHQTNNSHSILGHSAYCSKHYTKWQAAWDYSHNNKLSKISPKHFRFPPLMYLQPNNTITKLLNVHTSVTHSYLINTEQLQTVTNVDDC